MNVINQILPLRDHKELNKVAAAWFHEKWKIPEELYLESIEACQQETKVPQWYVVLNAEGEIIAGLGVIDNDFHKRPDFYEKCGFHFYGMIEENSGELVRVYEIGGESL